MNATSTVKTAPPPDYPQVFDTFDEYRVFQNLPCPASGVFGTYLSCGASVLSGITHTKPSQIVDKILKERSSTDKKYTREAFVLFSDIDRHPNYETGGNALCRFIKDNKLGDILEAGPRMNPNTGNMIKMWIWSPPHASLDPRDKLMPIYGKKLINGPAGPRYEDDPRFIGGLHVRGA